MSDTPANVDRRFGKRDKPWTRKSRRKPDGTLPARWEPKLLDSMDSRLVVVRKLRQRVAELQEEMNADSILKRMLCDRFIFMQTALETAEANALQNGGFDPGPWTQMVNAAVGIIRALGGPGRKAKPVQDLRSYVTSKGVQTA